MSVIDGGTVYQRSAEYYSSQCNLIIALKGEDVVYGVTEEEFCGESPSFDMSYKPEGAKTLQEDMEALIEFRSSSASTCVYALTRALQVSSFYKMNETRHRVIEALSTDERFSTNYPLMLRMGHLANVKEWFYSAFKKILSSPISALSVEEYETIGVELLHELVRSRKLAEVKRILTILRGPTYQRSPLCRDRMLWRGKRCEKAWKDVYQHFSFILLCDGDVGEDFAQAGATAGHGSLRTRQAAYARNSYGLRKGREMSMNFMRMIIVKEERTGNGG
ncbi:hypothetical protein BC835DRAFT_1425155 [Cytidiella melzeri]|nr:hypothetical protein BC835DRAFT_1425155 [Cytidiella melzeri]